MADNEGTSTEAQPGAFICDVRPVNEECGPLSTVPGIPYPVPVPCVLDMDYRTGHLLRVRMDLGPGGAYGVRALTFTAADDAGDVSGQTLRSARLSDTIAHVLRYLRGAEKDYAHLGGLASHRLTVPLPWDPEREKRMRLTTPHYPSMTLTPDGLRIEPQYRERLRELGPSSDVVASTVATLYRTAAEAGRPPVEFVAQVLEIPKRTASHWVKLARQVGALEASTRGRRGGAPDGDD